MSSRALRRAQKEQEERELQEKLAQMEQQDEEEESEDDVAPKPQPKPSLFAMLGDAGDDEDEDDDDDNTNNNNDNDQDDPPVITPPTNLSKKSKKKKKKAKAKSKAPSPPNDAADAADSGLDEIDQALLALQVTSSNKNSDEPQSSTVSEETQQLFSTLSIDTTHLHAANEMKKLFGRTALQHADDDEPRQRQQQGIAARVNGRNTPGSRLTGLSLRRNIFIQGKEEWPRATSGGLGMEVVEKHADGSIEYRFVHSTAYQETQRQFNIAVASMDPERMVQLLHTNPYHISTLLQVSEIAKQQRDNASASDLLERALFTFGRSVHSTFSSSLAAGKARLSFARPENREFFLAIWRYIATLSLRATYRTALEWTRLLMALAPEEDPYCARLMVDTLALRARAPAILLAIADTSVLERAWKIPPNIAYSTALAHLRTSPTAARTALKNAVREYPWLAARLCKDLAITPIPKPIWGIEPTSPFQEILCQQYISRSSDLWNTSEHTSLLVEICYTFDAPPGDGADPYWLHPIPPLDLARHVILSDDQPLIALLDTSVKEQYTSVSDPLPPPNNTPSYASSAAGPDRTRLLADLDALRTYFQRIDIEGLVAGGLTEEHLVTALRDAQSSLDEFRRNSERFQVVRDGLRRVGVEVVFEGVGGAGDGVGGEDAGLEDESDG